MKKRPLNGCLSDETNKLHFHCVTIHLMTLGIFMAALRSRCGHYIFALSFLSFFFFSPNVSGRRLVSTILPHMVWP